MALFLTLGCLGLGKQVLQRNPQIRSWLVMKQRKCPLALISGMPCHSSLRLLGEGRQLWNTPSSSLWACLGIGLFQPLFLPNLNDYSKSSTEPFTKWKSAWSPIVCVMFGTPTLNERHSPRGGDAKMTKLGFPTLHQFQSPGGRWAGIELTTHKTKQS